MYPNQQPPNEYPAQHGYQPMPPPPGGAAGPAYGHPGYPPGMPPQRTTNGLAVAALITGLLGMCLLAIPFGFIALSQIKTRGQGGRGLAITGLLASGAWVLLAAVGFVGGALDSSDDTSEARGGTPSIAADGTRKVSIFDVRVGDCIMTASEADRVDTVTVLPCDRPHDAEAITDVYLDDGPWPGLTEVKEQAKAACGSALTDVLGASPRWEELQGYLLFPSNEARWRNSTKVTCLVIDGERAPLIGKIPR